MKYNLSDSLENPSSLKSGDPIQLPPVLKGGWPIIGHLPEFMHDKGALFYKGYQELGNVFTVKIPKPIVVVTGSEHHQWFYNETDKSLNIAKGYEILKYAIGEIFLTASKEQYKKHRIFLPIIFGRERSLGYLNAMNYEVDVWLDRLGESGEMDIMDEMRLVTRCIAGHAFAGANFRDELGSEFWEAYSDIAKSVSIILPPDWPLPRYKRRDRARAKIRNILGRLCQQRRQAPEAYDDVISLLLNTPLDDGTYLDDQKAADLWLGLIFAGNDTTARQAAWCVLLTLQHPNILARLQTEVEVLNDSMDAMSFRSLPLTFQVIDETVRLKPSADMLLRVTEQEVQVGDYQIPAGWRVVIAAGSSHYLESKFSNPPLFDPDRFSKERSEGKDQYAIMGFGGGGRKCPGMNFAKSEMAIILAKLLRNYDLTLLTPNPKTISVLGGAPRPSPTRISYQRKRSPVHPMQLN
ncbi:MAG: cytochrome P450 [Nostoc sp.]|uniref:cytochrome P450 n=1 Tax=Nostoc sp. TaxID=1180 RepID=UPI002FFD4650